tara:strand:+ start:47 stop:274 length:228 start_codon:yes stop_codon:yes gene_type:complete
MSIIGLGGIRKNNRKLSYNQFLDKVEAYYDKNMPTKKYPSVATIDKIYQGYINNGKYSDSIIFNYGNIVAMLERK